MAHQAPQDTFSKAAARRTRLRARRRALFLATLALLLFGACLVPAGCGPDLGQLTEEAVALMSSGRFDEALPIQEQIAALDPSDAQIRVELGFNYLSHQDRPADAVAVFKEAVDLEPSAKNVTFLAQAYIGADEPVSAEETLRQAIDTDKSYGHSYEVLVTLLERQGRTADVTELRQAADSAGVTLASD